MPGKAAKIVITEKLQAILLELVNSRSASIALAQRSRIILLGFEGQTNEQIEKEVQLGHDQVGKGRRRWQKAFDRLVQVECTAERTDLVAAIKETLADVPRAGRPATITPEQQSKRIAKACEDPEKSGRPIGRWTASELADEMSLTNTIPQISSRWVSRLLARAAIRPHRIDYWLFSKDTAL